MLKVRRFGQDPKASITELELKWSDCPGDALEVVRDKSFAECGAKIRRGDKLAADVVLTFSSERGSYRNEIVRSLATAKVDPKDEANYELVQTCRPWRGPPAPRWVSTASGAAARSSSPSAPGCDGADVYARLARAIVTAVRTGTTTRATRKTVRILVLPHQEHHPGGRASRARLTRTRRA